MGMQVSSFLAILCYREITEFSTDIVAVTYHRSENIQKMG